MSSKITCLFGARFLVALAVAFCLSLTLHSQALGVGVSTSTYAKDSSASLPNPKVLAENKPSVTGTSSNILSSTSAANAQAWASAAVTAAGVVKSASGRSWVTAGSDSKATSWSSFATGTIITPHYTGPRDVNGDGVVDANDQALIDAGLPARFDLRIPTAFSDPNAPTDITTFALPSQGMFNDSGRIAGAPNFFDVFYSIDATLTPLSSGSTGGTSNLFHGSLLLDHNGILTRGGNFAATFFDNAFQVNTQNGRVTVSLPADLTLASTTLTSDRDYDIGFDVYSSMGDFTHPGGTQTAPTDFNFSTYNLSTPAGGGGSFGASFNLIAADQPNFTVQVVPEPSTWLLLSLGIVGLTSLAVRRNRLAKA